MGCKDLTYPRASIPPMLSEVGLSIHPAEPDGSCDPPSLGLLWSSSVLIFRVLLTATSFLLGVEELPDTGDHMPLLPIVDCPRLMKSSPVLE